VGEGGARSAPGEGSAWIIREMREYIFQNRSRLLKYVIVPIAKHPKAFIRQCCIPHLIAARLQMLASVYLDNGFAIKADEIKDVPLKKGPAGEI
jgi:hypothetical protein